MPPKTRITKEMVLDAALQILRQDGIENVSARTLSKALGCSTQPIMYNYKTADELRQALYGVSDEFHTNYIMSMSSQCDDPMLAIGMGYVRFAAEEKNIFRFLFQSDSFPSQSIADLTEDPSIQPLIEILISTLGVDRERAKEEFLARFMAVHGMASLLANNSMVYDGGLVERILNSLFELPDEDSSAGINDSTDSEKNI